MLPLCGTCRRPIKPKAACFVFKTHHKKCIEKAIVRAQS